MYARLSGKRRDWRLDATRIRTSDATREVVFSRSPSDSGMLLGLIGALLRMQFNVLAVTKVEHANFFIAIMLVAGTLTYPLLLLLFRGKESLRGVRASCRSSTASFSR